MDNFNCSFINKKVRLPSSLLDGTSGYYEEDEEAEFVYTFLKNKSQSTELIYNDDKEIDSTLNADSIEESEQNERINKEYVCKSKKEEKDIVKERASDVQIDKSGVYNFKASGIGDSYLIGTDYYETDQQTWANALVGGLAACPEVLNIPGELTDKNGMRKPVEIIGMGAFSACGNYDRWNGKTKRLKVPRQVKIIKEKGLAGLNDLESFEIEAGSQLEIIEEEGMTYIGSRTGQSDGKRTGILILPSTLYSVYGFGIWNCNLFHTVIYCGSHVLSNSTTLEWSVKKDTVVKVKDIYPSGKKIFNRLTPDRSNPIATDVTCSIMSGDLKYSLPKICSTPSCRIFSYQWIISFFLLCEVL